MAEDARTKGALCKQMVQMADYVLDGYRDQLASLSSSEGGGRKEAVFKVEVKLASYYNTMLASWKNFQFS